MRDPRVVCGREKWEKKKINRSFARGENWVPPCMALKKKKARNNLSGRQES